MNLQKAIEILQLHWMVPKKPRDHDFQDAIMEGIEALQEKLEREKGGKL